MARNILYLVCSGPDCHFITKSEYPNPKCCPECGAGILDACPHCQSGFYYKPQAFCTECTQRIKPEPSPKPKASGSRSRGSRPGSPRA